MSGFAPLFTKVKWQEGYQMADVDEFVARLEATLEGRPTDRPVTAEDVRNVQFTPVRFREGYSVAEVDAFLEQAESALRR
ncbi:DivIVA domain-containing protein [Kribbella amoyensis]|uniref:DivIVA domain-containing protein n=1 Tax=Kribbella amoyensis TaxID=996641 RepID=A0A561B0Y2_9ACTN|nr:DivIVA domain-containing protein [Kribbella amoyensis]TWD72492.1 DivIVA domain-containing protein [Kribbella amoyensis]